MKQILTIVPLITALTITCLAQELNPAQQNPGDAKQLTEYLRCTTQLSEKNKQVP